MLYGTGRAVLGKRKSRVPVDGFCVKCNSHWLDINPRGDRRGGVVGHTQQQQPTAGAARGGMVAVFYFRIFLLFAACTLLPWGSGVS